MKTLLAALLLAAPVALADASVVINHQGRLLNADDTPVEGEVSLKFTVFRFADPQEDGSDPEFWTQTSGASVQNGFYDVLLGDTASGGVPLPATALGTGGEARWLEVSVNGTAMKPRQRLSSVPWAAYALEAQSATKALALECEGCVDSAALANGSVGNDQLASDLDGAKLANESVRWSSLEALPAAGTTIANLGATHAHDDRYFRKTDFAATGSAEIDWSRLRNIPQLGEQYSAGTGITIDQGVISLTNPLAISPNAGLSGAGTAASPLAIAPGGITARHLAGPVRVFSSLMTPKWLQANADIHAARAVTFDDTSISVAAAGATNNGTRIFTAPMLPSAVLDPAASYLVRIVVNQQVPVGDNDPVFGITDGTKVIGVMKGDAANTDTIGWATYGNYTNNFTSSQPTLPGPASSISNFEILLRLAPVAAGKTGVFAAIRAGTSSSQNVLSTVFDRTKALSFVVYANDAPETYVFNSFEITVDREN